MPKIPFNRPVLFGKEIEYILDALDRMHVSGDGYYTKRCQTLLAQISGARETLLCTSGTHALEMTAILLDIEPGNEVIVPSFTFVSTANAYALRGAKLVFADIRRDTLNIDESRLESLMTPRTKAIVVVHYAGVGCEMDTILEIAARHGVRVIEDNAHGLFGRYKQRNLGTFGCLAAQSFHETKNVTCGEGGALLINDAKYIERAEVIREKGTNRNRFFRGQIDKYTWIDIGSSYVPSDLLAAFLCAQLERKDQIQRHRGDAWHIYYRELQQWSAEHLVRLPVVPSHCEQAYHMFYVLLPSLKIRQAIIEHLGAHGISSVFHYQPLHTSEMGRKFGGRPGDCPVTEDVSDRLLRLPFYNNITEAEQSAVIAVLKAFDNWGARRAKARVV